MHNDPHGDQHDQHGNEPDDNQDGHDRHGDQSDLPAMLLETVQAGVAQILTGDGITPHLQLHLAGRVLLPDSSQPPVPASWNIVIAPGNILTFLELIRTTAYQRLPDALGAPLATALADPDAPQQWHVSIEVVTDGEEGPEDAARSAWDGISHDDPPLVHVWPAGTDRAMAILVDLATPQPTDIDTPDEPAPGT